ncbi:MAG: hypothetical protein ACI3W9_05525 [Eubacteriales bacterium]
MKNGSDNKVSSIIAKLIAVMLATGFMTAAAVYFSRTLTALLSDDDIDLDL